MPKRRTPPLQTHERSILPGTGPIPKTTILGKLRRSRLSTAGSIAALVAATAAFKAPPQGCETVNFSSNLLDRPSAAAALVHSGRELTVTSYNIKMGGLYGLKAVGQVLKSNPSTITCLQEATPPSTRYLQRVTHSKYAAAGWSTKQWGMSYGMATLSNLPVLHSESYKLPDYGFNPKLLFVTTVLFRHQPLVIANTHLINRGAGGTDRDYPGYRAHQAAVATQILKQDYPRQPIEFCGDFNTDLHSRALKIVRAAGFSDVARELGGQDIVTLPGQRETVDHILINRQLTPLAFGELSGDASDHCAISGVIALR